jgi:pimeloyl-ACP methyl ester carboxylesterase
MDSVTVDGRRLRVHRAGVGTRLVYLHSELGEVGPIELHARLADAGFEVVAPELPGFGASEAVLEWHRIEDVVFDLRRILQVLGVDRALVVGSSLGGWLAAELAVWFPELVEGLVLLGPLGLRIEGALVFELFGSPRRVLVARMFPRGVDLATLLAPGLDGEGTEALLVHLFHAMEATARIGWNPYLHDPKLAGRLGLVRAPTVVAWGSDDGFLPRAHAEAYAERIPKARLEILEGAGHLPALECPERVVALVAAAWRSQGVRLGEPTVAAHDEEKG